MGLHFPSSLGTGLRDVTTLRSCLYGNSLYLLYLSSRASLTAGEGSELGAQASVTFDVVSLRAPSGATADYR
ncbi:hypothetical protein NDU88_004771 [Pleurodeles waltl]|uniref:Uncharacterized protein n=1 Tax=Pleurodeles waltl TaxID=8319 RepID=A0AAV7VKT0_PLEWA|nr:hypothetical protein NDU88_004771 [Pleurodeles waltl]